MNCASLKEEVTEYFITNEKVFSFIKRFYEKEKDVLLSLQGEVTIDERDLYSTCGVFLNIILVIGISYSPLNYEEIENRVFSVLVIYVIVDSLLDGDYPSKKKLLRFIRDVLDKGETEKEDTPLFSKIKENILSIKQKCDLSSFKKAFLDEKRSLKQSSATLSKEELLAISSEKSFYFVKGILELLEISIFNEKQIFSMGKILQLTDDIIDYEKDISEGITTIVRWCFDNEGSADFVFRELFDEIEKVSDISLKFFFRTSLFLVSCENLLFSENVRKISSLHSCVGSGYDYELFLDFYYLQFVRCRNKK